MKLTLSIVAYLAVTFSAVTGTSALAQTFTNLANLDSSNGTASRGSLVQGVDGKFYGTTQFAGANGQGTVFKVATNGTVTTVYSFCSQTNCADGEGPVAGLVQDTDGKFYGTTSGGGTHGYGTVFRMTSAGKVKILYSFCSQLDCSDGATPSSALARGTDGSFYGTTYGGGASNPETCAAGCGTVFKITRKGQLTTLHTFCPLVGCTDGENPLGALIQATDGNFYGTTTFSGNSDTCSIGCGTAFTMTPAGVVTTLYTFCSKANCTDGGDPRAGLVEGANGNFYGTTSLGGVPFCGPFGFGCGTVFKLTSQGKLTTLHSFEGTDGLYQWSGLALGTDGNFYGTTLYGGVASQCNADCGTLYRITPTGTLTTLHTFCAETNCADGDQPFAGLVQSTNGAFYGTTFQGGVSNFVCSFGCGTVFSLGMGLDPFVETRPGSGAVGAAVVILGTNLRGATGVSFNGVAATFRVVSKFQIKTNVPPGAGTGFISVTTPGGKLSSNVVFRVTP